MWSYTHFPVFLPSPESQPLWEWERKKTVKHLCWKGFLTFPKSSIEHKMKQYWSNKKYSHKIGPLVIFSTTQWTLSTTIILIHLNIYSMPFKSGKDAKAGKIKSWVHILFQECRQSVLHLGLPSKVRPYLLHCVINLPGTSDLHLSLSVHVFDLCLFVSVVCVGISLLACMQQGELLYKGQVPQKRSAPCSTTSMNSI